MKAVGVMWGSYLPKLNFGLDSTKKSFYGISGDASLKYTHPSPGPGGRLASSLSEEASFAAKLL